MTHYKNKFSIFFAFTIDICVVKTMTIDEAAKYLRENGVKISKETLSDGIQAEKLPFGVCIETGRSRVFMIFKRLVDKWLEEREEV